MKYYTVEGLDTVTGYHRSVVVTASDPMAAIDAAKEKGVMAYTKPGVTSVFESSPNGDSRTRCPKCGSDDVSANKKGFSLGQAAAGGLLLGPLGLLGGAVGANSVKITCLKCGKTFSPGGGR